MVGAQLIVPLPGLGLVKLPYATIPQLKLRVFRTICDRNFANLRFKPKNKENGYLITSYQIEPFQHIKRGQNMSNFILQNIPVTTLQNEIP